MVKYEIIGNRSADKTLLFSNSLGNDWTSWNDQFEFFKNDFKIVRYHTHAMQGATIDSLCEDIIEIIKKENLENVHFCGISLGGLIGIKLGISYADYFKSITVANTSPKIVTKEIWDKRITDVKENGFLNVIEGSPSRWFSEDFIKENPKKIRESLMGFSNTHETDYINCCHVLAHTDLWSDLSKINIPFHIISGSLDPVTTEKEANEMKSKISHAKLTVLKASHLSQIECADEFNKKLNKFIADA